MLPTETSLTTSLNVSLIQSSYLIIKQQSDAFATTFYQILFDKYPQVRALFTETDMKKQKAKLIESLDLVLVNVHSPEAFTPILKALGKRHVKYGAVLTDYPLIGDALLQALEQHLGTNWNSEVRQAWAIAYQTIADTMAEGARTEIDNNPQTQISWESNPTTDVPTVTEPSSRSTSPSKLLTIACTGLVAIGGYGIWNLQSQSNNAPTPTTSK